MLPTEYDYLIQTFTINLLSISDIFYLVRTFRRMPDPLLFALDRRVLSGKMRMFAVFLRALSKATKCTNCEAVVPW